MVLFIVSYKVVPVTESVDETQLFIMLYKVVLTFHSADKTQMKGIEWYFHVVLLFMLWKVVLLSLWKKR